MAPVTTIDNTFGALEIGSSFAIFLFGIVTLQTYLYFSRFHEDRLVVKALVGTVWCLELGHTIGVSCEIYRTTITLYGRPDLVLTLPGFGVSIILGGWITMLVQNFFNYRVWSVLPNPWRYIGLFSGALASARGVMSTYAGVQSLIIPNLDDYGNRFRGFNYCLLAMGVVIDVTIAVSMMWYLIRQRGKSLSRVSRVIDRLLAYTVRTGLFTSIAAIAVLVLYQTMFHTYIYLAVYTLVAKLYSNSFLSSLNARVSLRETVAQSVSMEAPRAKAMPGKGYTKRNHAAIGPYHGGTISIEMKTTTDYMNDERAYYQVPLTTSTKMYTSEQETPPISPVRNEKEKDTSDTA
ncbi:hypothetical protein M413DRAFT_448378 [Hebeloma cylindrosporum]|uniref:DUF6534 domain-containing protein n=1 Tax=Hebeloma cylindrosporum TaxID=76867 RepID=A0A0C3BLK2_HEBCY|nr:hypothetical protein M413DRAFT_448378 [Hebeloma cylindrosporum h7]